MPRYRKTYVFSLRISWQLCNSIYLFLNHSLLGYVVVILKEWYSNTCFGSSLWVLLVKLPWRECQRTPLINQHYFRLSLCAVEQQTPTRTNVDPDQCRPMASQWQHRLKHAHSNIKRHVYFALDIHSLIMIIAWYRPYFATYISHYSHYTDNVRLWSVGRQPFFFVLDGFVLSWR